MTWAEHLSGGGVAGEGVGDGEKGLESKGKGSEGTRKGVEEMLRRESESGSGSAGSGSVEGRREGGR